jgi:hypothetical protein
VYTEVGNRRPGPAGSSTLCNHCGQRWKNKIISGRLPAPGAESSEGSPSEASATPKEIRKASKPRLFPLDESMKVRKYKCCNVSILNDHFERSKLMRNHHSAPASLSSKPVTSIGHLINSNPASITIVSTSAAGTVPISTPTTTPSAIPTAGRSAPSVVSLPTTF